MFSAFSPLNGGTFQTYYNDRNYPLDLNGAQDYTRPATTYGVYGYPYLIGHVSGLCQQFNSMELDMMTGKNPTGFWAGDVPWSLATIFPNLQGGFRKVG